MKLPRIGFGFAALVLCACSGATDEGGEDATSSEDHLLAGRRFSPAEVARMLRAQGFPEEDVSRMVCTAKYESSFYEGAKNLNTNGTTDWGLFQINDRYWLRPCGVTRQQLLDAATNVRCAKVVYDEQGLGAWYGYKSHRGTCDDYDVPNDDGSSGGGASSSGGCYSATLQARVDEGECVQSRSNGRDYQCKGGLWYRITGSSGPAGECTERHRLDP